MVAAARKLTFISEATSHLKILTGGRMVAVARILPVFFRRVPLDIRRRSCEATRRGQNDCMARNLPVFIRWVPLDIRRRLCEATQPGEKEYYGSQPPSLYPTGAARHPPPVV